MLYIPWNIFLCTIGQNVSYNTISRAKLWRYERVSQDEITCFRISETWRKHATPCFRYVYLLRKRENSSLRDSVTFPERKCQKVVRFRCNRSNGNVSKRHETANGNTGYPSCFRSGFTCFCDVSVYGFLEFRPVCTQVINFVTCSFK